jgi:hypothetical protein
MATQHGLGIGSGSMIDNEDGTASRTLVVGDKVHVDRQGGHLGLAPEPHRDGHVARPGGQAQDDERVPEGDTGIEPVTS